MSRRRGGVLLAILAAVVAGGSFVVARAAFDDDGPAAPPNPTGAAEEEDGAGDASVVTVPVATAELDSPSWIVVIASRDDESNATGVAQQVAATGHSTGVLRSDDYPSLNEGFWVAYAGPYEDRASAEAGVGRLEADGWTGAYVRCAGSRPGCAGRHQ